MIYTRTNTYIGSSSCLYGLIILCVIANYSLGGRSLHYNCRSLNVITPHLKIQIFY
jgi:hypothetical protein